MFLSKISVMLMLILSVANASRSHSRSRSPFLARKDRQEQPEQDTRSRAEYPEVNAPRSRHWKADPARNREVDAENERLRAARNPQERFAIWKSLHEQAMSRAKEETERADAEKRMESEESLQSYAMAEAQRRKVQEEYILARQEREGREDYIQAQQEAEEICKELGLTGQRRTRSLARPGDTYGESYSAESGWYADPAAFIWAWYRQDRTGDIERLKAARERSRGSASSAVTDSSVLSADDARDVIFDADKVEEGDEVYVPKYKHNNPWIVKRKYLNTLTLTSSPHSSDPEHPRDPESRMRLFNVSASDIDHDQTVKREVRLREDRLRKRDPQNLFDMYEPAE